MSKGRIAAKVIGKVNKRLSFGVTRMEMIRNEQIRGTVNILVAGCSSWSYQAGGSGTKRKNKEEVHGCDQRGHADS